MSGAVRPGHKLSDPALPPAPVRQPRRLTARRLAATPLLLAAVLLATYLWISSAALDPIERASLSAGQVRLYMWQSIELTAVSTVCVLLLAIPAGIALTRRLARPAVPPAVVLANLGQATPAIGLLALLTFWLGIGQRTALVGMVAYAVLPVLSNTMRGLRAIDPTLLDAARGIGMSPLGVLGRVELPLAVPLILAGVRTALVLNVGTSTLAAFVSGGGLGNLITGGILTQRTRVLLVGSVLAVALALLVDWLAAIAEVLLSPRGLEPAGEDRRPLAASAVLALAAQLAGCGLHSGSVIPDAVRPGSIGRGLPLKGATLTITSKNFTEGIILAEMIGLAFKAAGATVEDRTDISGSIGARQAILSGTADATYDYTGTAWITYLGRTEPIADPQRQWRAVHDADLKNGVSWLPQSRLNNTYAFAGNKAAVAKYRLRTLSDVAALARARPSAVTLCVDNEFAVRADGLPGVLRAYRITVPKANIRSMDAGIVYTTTARGRSCLLGDVYSTDGRIPELGLQVLTDNKHFFPNYNAAPVIRSSTLRQHPVIAALLDPISARLDTTTAQRLNARVDVRGQDPRQVAEDWLVQQGFIRRG